MNSDPNSRNYDFNRNVRLLTKQDFNLTFSKGKKLHNRYFSWVIAKNELNYPRLGIIIAKRNVKLAVQRNRIKRLIRESFRQEKENLSNLDIVVIGKKGVNSLPNAEISNLLSHQWKKIETL